MAVSMVQLEWRYLSQDLTRQERWPTERAEGTVLYVFMEF